ncbi:unnamed protein product [Effrenium voratum]|uniref:EF-hand domain-containing protein n=1 Tax=Effrenium voratum TaxID=2562239 RepID=A0AA36MLX5_9DINO|nr:unnamed protein product [Effrenium voratum]CAJ1413386.1 unnamed protein product [Effrenium voratum]
MSGYYQPAFPQLYGQSQGSYPQSQAPQQSYPARSADPRYPQGYAAAAQTQAAPQAAQAPAAQAYAGYQPAQGQAQAQPAAREEVVGNVAHISVTGCTHSTVGGIVRGSFTASGQNHGRPTYKKDTQVNGLDVQLYYWDDRDGASFCGWWFGPKVGGDQVWAYHPSSTAMTPPKGGWKVPYDGPVDHSFAISAAQPPAAQAATAPGAAAGATAATAAQYAVYQQQLQQYQQQQQAYQQQQDQQTQMQQQMIAQQQKALQMAEMQKKQEEMKRRQEEMRRQQEEARQRQQEEVKRKAAEHRVKMEEMNRQKMEQEKRMAEERKKQYEEQRATIRIRTCMQKVRMSKEEDLATNQQELAELMQVELPNCGSNAVKVQEECAQAVEQALKRIEAQKEVKRREEERKEEALRKQRELQEKAAALLKECSSKVAAAEELVEAVVAAAAHLAPEKELKLEAVQKAASALEAKAEAATAALAECGQFSKEKSGEMRMHVKPKDAEDDTPTLAQVLQRINEAQKKKDTAVREAGVNKDKLTRKAEAKKKLDAQLLKFKKYDANKDELLDKKEVIAYAKKEFSLTLNDARASKILSALADGKGVKKDDFQRLKVQIGIVREAQKDLARRKLREEHDKEIEKTKEGLKEKVVEADEKYSQVEGKVKEVEEAGKPLITEKMKSTEMQPLLEQLEEKAQELKAAIAGFKAELQELKSSVDQEVSLWFQGHCKPLDSKTAALEPRMQRWTTLLTRSRAEMKNRATAELNVLETQMVAMIRQHQKAKGLSADDLYAAMSTSEEVSKKDFLKFFQSCEVGEAERPPAEELTRLFTFLAGGDSSLPKERMMGIIRSYKKVLKDTILTKERGVNSGAVRKLAVGEILEITGQESADEEVDVVRVQCRTLKDDEEGWVTVSGNHGTPFLAEYKGVYKVVKETIITPYFELDSAEQREATKQLKEPVDRKLRPGELVDVWVWPKKEEKSGLVRLKCKCRSDGTVGWVTAVGNAGTVFLEVV